MVAAAFQLRVELLGTPTARRSLHAGLAVALLLPHGDELGALLGVEHVRHDQQWRLGGDLSRPPVIPDQLGDQLSDIRGDAGAVGQRQRRTDPQVGVKQERGWCAPGAVGAGGTTVGVLEQRERQVVAGQRGRADDMDGQGRVAYGFQPRGERVQPRHTRLVGQHQQRWPAARVGVVPRWGPVPGGQHHVGRTLAPPEAGRGRHANTAGNPTIGRQHNQPVRPTQCSGATSSTAWEFLGIIGRPGSHRPGQGDGAV